MVYSTFFFWEKNHMPQIPQNLKNLICLTKKSINTETTIITEICGFLSISIMERRGRINV